MFKCLGKSCCAYRTIVIVFALGITFCAHLNGDEPTPIVIRNLVEKQYRRTISETKRCIEAATNENEVFDQVILGISRGMLVRQRTTLHEARSVFGDRMKMFPLVQRGKGRTFKVSFPIKYAFYDDYETRKQVLKGGAYWVLWMKFGKDGVLRDFRLTC